MKTTFPKDNPFRTPEGYFDTLTDRVMAGLPRQQQPQRRLWPYAAAACLAAALCIGGYIYTARTAEAPATALESSYIDEALDYALVDNNEIATYLTSNE